MIASDSLKIVAMGLVSSIIIEAALGLNSNRHQVQHRCYLLSPSWPQFQALPSAASSSALSCMGKLKYVSRLERLWEDVRRNGVELPDFVTEHDEEDLEYNKPMTDYGLESDHRTPRRLYVLK